MRGIEACKSEQEGQRREKEEQLYAELEGLKAQLEAFQSRNSALDGEALLLCAPSLRHAETPACCWLVHACEHSVRRHQGMCKLCAW